ncbi:hypothetical protein KAF44_29365 (plasmid) [Cupriavidus necator]|nr:hypothetical protein KAF44_29365 [Cupriavidus necator]
MTQNTRSGVGRLSADKRKAIALQALARTEPYRQIGMASAALDEAFDTTRAADADQVPISVPAECNGVSRPTVSSS